VQTVLTTSPAAAARFIREGGVVGFPTETVYGLGADVFNTSAVEKVFEAKQRPGDNPLIAHISSLDQIQLLASLIPETASKLIQTFFPGPLTLVLPKAERVPMVATAGLDSIGIRMPRHELAREFLQHCETPVVAPSANLSGRPSPTTWQAVEEDLGGRIDCILQGDDTEIGLESTVVDCTSDVPRVLRSGAISIEELRRVVASVVDSARRDSEPARSPGMKHKHYSPRARVIIVENGFMPSGRGLKSFIGFAKPAGDFCTVKICDSLQDYAHSLFSFFRESDHASVEDIYCEKVFEEGIGVAIMDRLQRAAEAK
jgi:L-threonylcarbamoyladenylate synthase